MGNGLRFVEVTNELFVVVVFPFSGIENNQEIYHKLISHRYLIINSSMSFNLTKIVVRGISALYVIFIHKEDL